VERKYVKQKLQRVAAEAAILFVEGDVDYLIGSIIVRDHLLNYT
jgi:hypothetical protein